MRDDTSPFRILLALDFARSVRSVFAFAKAFAAAVGAEVTLLYVDAVHPPDGDESDSEDEGLFPTPDSIRNGLQSLRDDLARAGIRSQARCVHSLAVAPTILAEARTVEADFIIVGTHDVGMRRYLVGSVSDELLRTSDRTLILVNANESAPQHDASFTHILVPVESPADDSQIDQAIEIASRAKSEVHLLHIPEHLPLPSLLTSAEALSRFLPKEDRQVEEEAAEIRVRFEEAGIAVRSSVAEGLAPRLIENIVEEVDASLVILPRHEDSAIRRFVLSVITERVARSAGRPVMIIADHERDAH